MYFAPSLPGPRSLPERSEFSTVSTRPHKYCPWSCYHPLSHAQCDPVEIGMAQLEFGSELFQRYSTLYLQRWLSRESQIVCKGLLHRPELMCHRARQILSRSPGHDMLHTVV